MGVWVGGLRDMLVRKFPPLAGLPKKGVRDTALSKVTGDPAPLPACKQAFKPVRTPSSAQPWARGECEPNLTRLCQAGASFWASAGEAVQTLPPLFKHPAASKDPRGRITTSGSLLLPFVP